MKFKNVIKLFLLVAIFSCGGDSDDPCTPNPTLTTNDVTEITDRSVKLNGKVVAPTCDATVTSQGFVYSKNTLPKISDNIIEVNGANISGVANNLEQNTKYYARVFFTNPLGTFYGNEILFNTAIGITLLYTIEPTNITMTTARSGGVVNGDGGSPIMARGICWGTTPNPTVSNFKTVEGSGLGSFISNLTDLSSKTKYYVRIYATNAGGTTYGDEKSFTTPALATLTTNTVSAITSSTATSGGVITDNGGATVSSRGVIWSTSPNPSIGLPTKTSNGYGDGSFTSNLTELAPNTTYYLRAYAYTFAGFAYGQEISFKTLVALPTVTTTAATSITSNSAISGGNVTSEGGGSVTARGVVWSTTSNPTIDNKLGITSNGSGSGAFSSNITGLTYGTTYYVRAYVTNSVGTSYGSQTSFNTLPIIPTLTTTTLTYVTTSTATTGGNITNNGGANITARGVVWSTSPNPTIALTTKTSDGTGSGSFISSISGAAAKSTFYVRAYATNSAGTAYGQEFTFTTQNDVITDVDGNSYNIVSIGKQMWFKENLKTTKYCNGSSITFVNADNTWNDVTNGAYSYYNDNSSFNSSYGKLYNGYAASDNRNVCPCDWRVPTKEDFNDLIAYLVSVGFKNDGTGPNTVSKALAVSSYGWGGSMISGTPGSFGINNSSGFSAFAGGHRFIYYPFFEYLNQQAYFYTGDANNYL